MGLPRKSEKSIHHLTFFTQLSISVHSFLILSLCICIFCSCTHSAYILCSDCELAQHRCGFGVDTVPVTIPGKGVQSGDVPSMYLLGKVTKREENVDTDIRCMDNCLQRISVGNSACTTKN